MLDFWKDYGVIAVLLAVALGGYYLIGDRREELMDYTLDMLGTRLVELSAREDDRDAIARQFALFQERVEREEVSQEMVEAVAANVLNLRVRGAVITPEEAELMLFSEPGEQLPAPDEGRQALYTVRGTSGDPTPPKDLDERLTVMFQLADAIQVQGDSASYHLHFAQDQHGIHVVLDPSMAARLESGEAKALYENLERKDWIKWQDNLARDQAKAEQRMKQQVDLLARAEVAAMAAPEMRSLERWTSAQKLALSGATANMDTVMLHREIGALLKQLSLEFDSLGVSTVRIHVPPAPAERAKSGN
jgi:hypothetical protein